MKAHPSCVQELHPLFLRVGAAGCDLDTFTLNSSSRRRRIRRLPTSYFSIAALTGKSHTIVSIGAVTLFPCCSSQYLYKPKSLKLGRINSCSCSSNDADFLEAKLRGGSDESPEPLSYSSSNSEEEVESYGYGDAKLASDPELVSRSDEEEGIRIQIVKLGKRSRRIESSILIKASLSTIWGVLTDYERLADFIPGLAVNRLLDKRDKYARLFQIGQQDLALGLKFNAKAVIDCYEKDLEILSNSQKRDIEFKMVEGDFETFEGRWSIVQRFVKMKLVKLLMSWKAKNSKQRFFMKWIWCQSCGFRFA